MSKLFINFSNHPSALWSEAQKAACGEGAQITDIPFPEVSPLASEEEINAMAREYFNKIKKLSPAAVLCQGEFTLVYQVITLLKKENIVTVAACSERRVTEKTVNGKTRKMTVFEFVKYRRY